jgi:hypothetical protein
MKGVWVRSGWASGNFVGSYELNFAPSYVVAWAALSKTTGGGTQACGIAGYRDRDANGVDHWHGLGNWVQWPLFVAGPNFTNVTIGVATGSDQWMQQLSEVQFW